jgi:hypothetical protein
MTPNAAKEAIYNRFITLWTSKTTVILDNEGIAPPDNAAHVFLTVKSTFNNQRTLGGSGNRKYDRNAIIFVKINTLANTGISTSEGYVKDVLDIFEGVSFSGVICNNSQVSELGSDGKWYSVIVEIDCSYEDTK